MIIDLSRFFSDEAKPLDIDYSFSLESEEIDGVHPFVSPVRVSGKLSPFSGSAVLEASAEYDFSKPCDRCAEETRRSLKLEVSHTLVPELSNEEDDDSFIQAVNGSLDLDELIYSDIILEMPSKYVCSESCKGLCPTCGANLNKGDCGCAKNRIDPRMEILKQLLDNND